MEPDIQIIRTFTHSKFRTNIEQVTNCSLLYSKNEMGQRAEIAGKLIELYFPSNIHNCPNVPVILKQFGLEHFS